MFLEFEPQHELQSVTFSGSDSEFIKVVQDDGSDYPTPPWERTNPSPSPVGYVRNSHMKATVTLQTAGTIPDKTIYIKGNGPDGLEFAAVQNTLTGGSVTATLQSTTLPDHVDYLDTSEFQVTWSYAHSADGPWYEAGTSQNQLYVTLDTPKTSLVNPSPVYHTLIHLGSKNARGESSESLVVDKIWNEFTDREVFRMDGEQLRYYHEYVADARNTADLLLQANGDCESWARFFIDMLKIQNISARLYDVREKTHPGEFGFLVKEMTFYGEGGSPETAPYVYIGARKVYEENDVIDTPNVNKGKA